MAIPPLLEQEDAKNIVKILLNSKMTVKELNEHIIKTKDLSISTATLYRRIKELYIAGYIEKLDDGSYTTSMLGKNIYNELFSNKTNVNNSLDDISHLIKSLSQKQSQILHKVQFQPSYTSGLLREVSISPNELVDIFKELIRLGLLEVKEKPGKKPGRPKKIYKISDKGLLLLQELEKLKLKFRELR